MLYGDSAHIKMMLYQEQMKAQAMYNAYISQLVVTPTGEPATAKSEGVCEEMAYVDGVWQTTRQPKLIEAPK